MEKNPTDSDGDDVGSSALPEDVIVYEIFSRLPVKSLPRARLLSKRSRSLTLQPPFVHAFLRRSAGRYVLSFLSGPHLGSEFYYSDPQSQNQIAGNLITGGGRYLQHTQISFLNGLVCLVNTDGSVVIRNAATNEQFLPPRFLHDSPMEKTYIYFCHDPGANRYKLLKATCLRESSEIGPVVAGMRFSILSIGGDRHSWRDFPQRHLYQLGESKSVCINGVVFITNFSTTTRPEDGVIAAYSVGSESFGVVRYPERLSWRKYSSCGVIDVKGSVGVVDVENNRIRLWIKKGECWVKRRMINQLRRSLMFRCRVYSVKTNVEGEMVFAMGGMSTSDACGVYCYSMERGRWRRIKMVGVEKQAIFSKFQIDEYMENPLLLRQILNF